MTAVQPGRVHARGRSQAGPRALEGQAGPLAPQNQLQSPGVAQSTAQIRAYSPPIAGLVTAQLSRAPAPQTAMVLENFWPTTTGIEPRGGSRRRWTIPDGAGIKYLFEYHSTPESTFFAATDTAIYQFTQTTPDGPLRTAVISGQTGADYTALEVQTDGGKFLTLVNGTDPAQIYDGTTWQVLTPTSAPHALIGIDSERLSHIWAYRNRTFFIETGTMNAWYLEVNSVSGLATKLPLSGLFSRGGALVFGATLSSDSGAGMDDRCVLATDRGQFALFSGSDPSDSQNWLLNGVFDIGEPLGKNCTLQVGGDLIVATKVGLVPLSAALHKDIGQLKLAALSRPISGIWEKEVTLSGTSSAWTLVKWPEKNAGFICPPPYDGNTGHCYGVNLETGAWTKFTGWAIADMAVLGGRLFYGDSEGRISECATGGNDNGEPFECKVCLGFDDLGAPGRLKIVHGVRGVWKSSVLIAPKHSVGVEYAPRFLVPPPAAQLRSSEDGRWGVSDWDSSFWSTGQSDEKFQGAWETLQAHGRTIACQAQITSGAPYKSDCELVAMELMYSTSQIPL